MPQWMDRVLDRAVAALGPEVAYADGQRARDAGKPAEALGYFERAEAQYARKLGGNHPYVVMAMSQRAWCLTALGRFREAVRLYQLAVAAKQTNGDEQVPKLEELRAYLADAKDRLQEAMSGTQAIDT